MMHQLVALCFVLGVVVAEPISKFLASTEDLDIRPFDTTNNSNHQVSRVLPDVPAYLILDIINALIGNKFTTALSLGVFVIEWLVSNSLVIIVGVAAAFGLCKFTGKCNLNYEEYVPVEHLKSLITPEHLETAENFLVSAVEKYAEEKGRAMRNRSLAY